MEAKFKEGYEQGKWEGYIAGFKTATIIFLSLGLLLTLTT